MVNETSSKSKNRGKATPDDVRHLYTALLGREPENENTVNDQLRTQPDFWDLHAHFYASVEHKALAAHELSNFIARHQDCRDVDVHADPADLDRLLDHIRNVWARYGREEPYWSVLVDKRYRMDVIEEASVDEFFASGEEEVLGFLDVCARNKVDVSHLRTVAELGCGLGRMAEHFAKRFEEYIGVDISDGHLAYARARSGTAGVKNATFDLLQPFLRSEATFDIFYSLIVLQHNPPPIMIYLLDRFLAKLRPGGVAYFQVPCYLFGYKFHVKDYLDKGQHPGMEMHALPQRYIFDVLRRHDCQIIETVLCGRIGPIGLSYSFLAQKRP
jgi:SAM-dependent methyltransferase